MASDGRVNSDGYRLMAGRKESLCTTNLWWRSRLARTILAGTLGAVLAATSAVTALADGIIVEDAAPATEDSGIIDASSETESAGDASGEAQTIVIEEAETEVSSDASGAAEDGQPTAATHVSVHDPSIVRSNEDGTCYVLGSHTASAKSSDLIQWTQINFDYGNPENTPFYGNLQETFQVPFRWAGYTTVTASAAMRSGHRM